MKKKLYRSRKHKVLGGIAGGLGEYFDIDPVLVRVVFLISIFSGVSILAYFILWIIIPLDNNDSPRFEEIPVKDTESSFSDNSKKTSTMKLFIGGFLIIIGSIYLLENILGELFHIDFSIIFPAILIAAGLLLIANNYTKTSEQV